MKFLFDMNVLPCLCALRILLATLNQFAGEIEAGALVVVVDGKRARVGLLPLA